MPLLVNGARVDLARPTGDMIRAHPHLEEKAKLLRSQPAQIVEPKGLLYVQQREFAVTTPKDGSVSILGSDDATTCHIVVLRHTGSGATCLTHCDGSDTEAEVSLIMSSVKAFSNSSGCGRLEVHLVGGFNDDRQLSQKLTNQLLRAFDLQPEDVHLVTFCVTELNDREEQDIHFPIIYGIAVNVKTAEIFPATFPVKGPDEDLRSAHILTGAPPWLPVQPPCVLTADQHLRCEDRTAPDWALFLGAFPTCGFLAGTRRCTDFTEPFHVTPG
ncbi:protein N-terminal asparagine amidohydrolase isoform X2 [Onychostruthus taczanowskii]|uniref:protein N-terminal asparagine amidohydrolase isoform X2 n=1 Tax=Onychostruthus taczanowskii TaxID=356909 RepID=UPI001B806F07|nr:protein N-terminal asparagine amidohydrolase isoform X2 [Onychostruthus taczanowskii]